MKIKDFDELENQFNEINIRLSQIDSLSKILLDCLINCEDYKPTDIQSLTLVLKEKIASIKEKFILIEQKFII